ncbi:uncharacterized protein LOC133822542 [Humulus lupulus]|uniref:uncharacterized protein LOC133822542 n=1 Tax=Humulus lupulus TaxID=3486 RepID=UPI002B40187D|nr:uncharacterized protein LOC133822542 [Humulus lupulus]
MNLVRFHYRTSIFPNCLSHSSSPQIPNLTLKCSYSSKTQTPARDRPIDFGKHKGKLLGTLPSNYLKWVSKTLRARDFEDWAKLADQVLQDPVYQDRIEWEFAQNILDGNRSSLPSSSGNGKAVSELLEVSEKFGWDNDDKVGWSRVDFELLGTSKSGRIPRVGGRNGGKREDLRVEKRGDGKEEGEGGERRRERRERMRMKLKKEEKSSSGSLGNSDVGGNGNEVMRLQRKKESAEEVYNPFPGRESLLKKVLQRRTFS